MIKHIHDSLTLACEILEQYEDAAVYVSDYFREKWGHTATDVAKLRARLEALETACR